MDTFSEIFQAMIQDHGQRPRNFGELDDATHEAEGVNPLTGDQFRIQFRIGADGIISAAQFTGKASSLATTSASVMTGILDGETEASAQEKIQQTLSWIASEEQPPDSLPEDELSLLLEIRNFPHRVRCASLAWRTAATALEQVDEK